MRLFVEIDLLATHPGFIPILASLYQAEWPSYYGSGGGADAFGDLHAACNRDRIPLALVAFDGDRVLGSVSLKKSSVLSSASMFPWVGALLVIPEVRGQGIGTQLVRSVTGKARELGFSTVYAAAERDNRIFQKAGWKFHDLLSLRGAGFIIYRVRTE